MGKIVVKNLRFGATDMKPRSIDWSEIDGEWLFWDVVTCSECNEALVLVSPGEQTHKDADPAGDVAECSGYVNTDGPLMNYFWPLPDGAWEHDTESEAMKLDGLPLCLVYLADTSEYGLALTGGGTNLAWEIAEAYIRLGLLPPTHIDLPVVGDRGKSRHDRAIIAAMARVYRTGRNQLVEKLKLLRRFAPEWLAKLKPFTFAKAKVPKRKR